MDGACPAVYCGRMETTPAWLKTYVRLIQAHLRRSDIDVRIGDRHAPDGTYATVDAEEQAAEAEVRFSMDFYNDTPQGQRDTVVHELLHLHFIGVDDMASAWVDKLAPVDYAMLRRMLAKQEERIVDYVSRILSPHLPLPPSKRRKKR